MWALLSLYLLAYLLAGLIAAGIYKRQARRTSARLLSCWMADGAHRAPVSTASLRRHRPVTVCI
jgi:hypothetical protein